MKVICKQTTSKGFDLKEVTRVFSNNYDYNFGGYGIELNTEYLVMGIAIYQDSSCIYYLVDVNGKTEWFPYLLFDISDNSLPRKWFLNVYEKNSGSEIYTISGFDELCNDENFYDLLLERDKEAQQLYFKRKVEFEKELEE